MSEAERQAHAGGEFDEAAAMRRREQAPEVAADLKTLLELVLAGYPMVPEEEAILRVALERPSREAELETALMGWHRPRTASGQPCRCVGCEDISRARDQVLARSAEEVERG